MKVSIFVDTNILFVSKYRDFTKVCCLRNFQKLVDYLKMVNQDGISIVLPQIVLDELIKQQVEEYEKTIQKIYRIKLPSVVLKEVPDYWEELKKMFKSELEAIKKGCIYDIVITSYPSNNILSEVIQRSIDKKPPFEGKNKNSDKGFKDVILWETLKKYKNENQTEKIIFLTTDTIFIESENQRILEKEYRDQFIDDIFFSKWNPNDDSDLRRILSELFEKEYEPVVENELFKKFDETIKKSNLIELFKDYSFYNRIDGEDYRFKECEVVNCSYDNTIAQFKDAEGVNFLYFVPELAIKFSFYNDNVMREMLIQDYLEFEIHYYPYKDEFVVIGHDGLGDPISRMQEPFVIKNNE